MTTLLSRHAASDLVNPASRAAQRKLRLMEIENEMRLEEAEALKMTEEQRQILIRSFTSVKVEFSDLDGLARNTSPQIPSATSNPIVEVHPPDHAFVILTNADLASFAPHETIRASASSRPRPRPSISSPDLSTRMRPFSSSSPSLKHSHSSLSVSTSSYLSSSAATIKDILSRKTSRSRSPINGLFPAPSSDAYESDGERTVRGSDSDADDDSPRPRKERKKSRSGRGRAASGSDRIVPPDSGSRSRIGPASGAARSASTAGSSQPRYDASRATALQAGSLIRDAATAPSASVADTGVASLSSALPRPKPAFITYAPTLNTTPTPTSSPVSTTFPSLSSPLSSSLPSTNIPRLPVSPPVQKPNSGCGIKANDVYHDPGSA
ncbi:hypothetical protein D9615_006184 [Tricholomella constricta]|uniref:Uncharacterized protein n=1 Tax=Tricholomella constricta TaxID=117010 RepID=A0A8H5HBC0_9AGAR|nr:hypothetical protein D9615_006184 [Tricholomella constricta]